MSDRLDEIRVRQKAEYMVNVPDLGDVRDVNQALRDINYLLGVRNLQAIELAEALKAAERAFAERDGMRAQLTAGGFDAPGVRYNMKAKV